LQQRIAGCRKKEVYGFAPEAQAIFFRRRHQPRMGGSRLSQRKRIIRSFAKA
jgi:hypothetical protein